MKRLGMNDSDILEVMGWRDMTMLRSYTAVVVRELAKSAHQITCRSEPSVLIKVKSSATQIAPFGIFN